MTTNEEGEEVEEGAGPVGNVPDILADSKTWQWAGISFGEYDTLLLQKSLKKLVAKAGATQLRFWGKIKGTKDDYYVAEAVKEAAGEPEEGATGEVGEPRGQGAN